MIPLIIAAAAGTARTIGGIASAGSNARAQRDLIKRAYKIAERKQERQQSFTREDANEELNARGVLNAGNGGGVPATGAIADAYRGKALNPTKSKVINGLMNPGIKTENDNQRRMALSSTKGSTGQANTLGGAYNADLSGQFYDEQNDLWNSRTAAINATKAKQAQDEVGAVENGINTAASVYSAAGAFGGARGAASAAAPGSPAGGVTIRGAFGIDPVDPLGLNKQSLSGFNFNVAGNQ